jgi:hypothetical protein
MAKDRAIGAALVAGAVIGVLIYGFLMFYFGYDSRVALYTLEITAFVAVFAILATTPPPVPLEPETPTTTAETPSAAQPTAEKKP